MAVKNQKLKQSLSQTAEENARVTQGTSKSQKTLKPGKPCDHSTKHLGSVPVTAPIVGVSIGSTLNMENYESLRVDVWLSDTVQPGETVQQAYDRISATVDTTLQKMVSQYTEE